MGKFIKVLICEDADCKGGVVTPMAEATIVEPQDVERIISAVALMVLPDLMARKEEPDAAQMFDLLCGITGWALGMPNSGAADAASELASWALMHAGAMHAADAAMAQGVKEEQQSAVAEAARIISAA